MLANKLIQTALAEPVIDLTSGEFTDTLAANKGWEDFNTSRVSWNTTDVVLSTATGFSGEGGFIANTDIHLVPGIFYTYRCYLSAKSGTGLPRLSVSAFEKDGTLASVTVDGTIGWISINFLAQSIVHNFYAQAYNASDVNSSVTITEVQFYRT